MLIINLTDTDGDHIGIDPTPYADMAEAHKAARDSIRRQAEYGHTVKAEITDRRNGHVFYIHS